MPKAITAMARKLAVLIYRMLKYGTSMSIRGWNITKLNIEKPNSNTFAAKRQNSAWLWCPTRKLSALLFRAQESS